MLQWPSLPCRLLVLPHLPLLILDPRLLPTRKFKVTFPDPLCNQGPQPTRLPLCLLILSIFERRTAANKDSLLLDRRVDIVELGASERRT